MFKYLVLASLLFTTCSTWGAMDEEDYDRWSKAAKEIELSQPYLLCEKAAKVAINQDMDFEPGSQFSTKLRLNVKAESASNPVNCKYFDPTTNQIIKMWKE